MLWSSSATTTSTAEEEAAARVSLRTVSVVIAILFTIVSNDESELTSMEFSLRKEENRTSKC